jgi:hypothetical protein
VSRHHGKPQAIGIMMVVGNLCPVCGRKMQFTRHIKGGGKQYVCHGCSHAVITDPKLGIAGTETRQRVVG